MKWFRTLWTPTVCRILRAQPVMLVNIYRNDKCIIAIVARIVWVIQPYSHIWFRVLFLYRCRKHILDVSLPPNPLKMSKIMIIKCIVIPYNHGFYGVECLLLHLVTAAVCVFSWVLNKHFTPQTNFWIIYRICNEYYLIRTVFTGYLVIVLFI